MYNMLQFFLTIFLLFYICSNLIINVPTIPNSFDSKESASSVENFSINLKKKLIRSIDEDYCIYTFNKDFDEIRDIVW